MSPELPGWDESQRPTAVAPLRATAEERANGDHLRQIHDMYRDGLVQVSDVIAQVVAGVAGVGEARELIHSIGLRATYEQLGSFCGQICRGIDVHHRIEDAHLYPALRAADEALGEVLDRLYEEHEVVHEMLVRLDATLVELVEDEARLADLQTEFGHLQGLMLSHFVYEENQIGLALGVHHVRI